MFRSILVVLTLAILVLTALIFFQRAPTTNSSNAVDNTSSDQPVIEVERDATGDGSAEHESAAFGQHAIKDSPTPLLDGWQKPAVTLLLTGEIHGYMEPCGCTENQSGGMSRRGDLYKRLTDRGWPVVGFDLGGSIKRNRTQSQFKFEAIAQSLNDLGFRALNLGPEELRLGVDYLFSQHNVDEEDALGFLSCNVVFYGDPEIGTPRSHRVLDIAGVKIGVTGLLGESVKDTVISRGNSDIEFIEPVEALNAVVAKMTASKPDLMVLLAHARSEEAKELARQFPQFALVLSTGAEDPAGDAEFVGNTMIVSSGKKGKYTGVVGFYPEAEKPLRWELVNLKRDDFDDSAGMIENMAYYQDRLQNERIVTSVEPVIHSSGSTFVGSARCADCHDSAYEIWQSTPHAKAFDSLDPVHQRHGHERLKGIARTFDPECLCCHVTGWDPQEVLRFDSGFLNREFASNDRETAMFELLRGSGCENCHGPGSRHIEMMEDDDDANDEQARSLVRMTLEQANSLTGCYKCHDNDNSPHFNFEKYWEKVKHYED